MAPVCVWLVDPSLDLPHFFIMDYIELRRFFPCLRLLFHLPCFFDLSVVGDSRLISTHIIDFSFRFLFLGSLLPTKHLTHELDKFRLLSFLFFHEPLMDSLFHLPFSVSDELPNILFVDFLLSIEPLVFCLFCLQELSECSYGGFSPLLDL